MKFELKSLFRHLRILPILIIVASFGFVIRVGDAYFGLKSLSGSAYAENSAPAEKKVEQTDDNTEPSAESLKTEGEAKSDIDLPSTEASKKETETKWQDAIDTDMADSKIKDEVFEDMTKRRNEIELREKKLIEREALLEAAQNELEKKFKEMEGLRDELRDLLKQQTADEAARIQSLVKIYSGMKPKDASRIFNTLDTDILMDVISHMPESKAGAIIALMEADRAKALTTLLAEQKKLPEVP